MNRRSSHIFYMSYIKASFFIYRNSSTSHYLAITIEIYNKSCLFRIGICCCSTEQAFLQADTLSCACRCCCCCCCCCCCGSLKKHKKYDLEGINERQLLLLLCRQHTNHTHKMCTGDDDGRNRYL